MTPEAQPVRSSSGDPLAGTRRVSGRSSSHSRLNPGGKRLLTAVLLAAWSVAIWWALTTTRTGGGELFPGSSFVFNLGHAVIFAVEALLIGRILQPDARPGHGRWLAASTLAWLYSGTLEWRQGFIDGRQSSAVDLVTNAIGAFGVPWMLAERGQRVRRMTLVAIAALVSALIDTLA